jgi:glycosyltransferase involved in cell wall biosynthesis
VPEQMRLLLFDWAEDGHHPVYVRRFAEALGSSMEISIAAPDSMMTELVDLEAEMIPLGRPRPAIDGRLRRYTRHVARRELGLLAHAAHHASAHHVLHLYADAVLPRLATIPSRGIRLTTLLFYPRAHYPDAFGVPLPFAQRVRAAAKEVAVAGWRRHRDAHAVMTLDEEAARRWSAKRGAPAYWVPEPTVERAPPVPASDRSGCILYGALADRKGIDLLARAIGSDPTPIRVTVAGEADPAFLPRLRELLAEMSRGGASVELRAHRHTETEGLHALASARCAVLPYPRHDGMSRVLVEACSVGTPVIVHDYGLLAHLVRRHGLGLAVDCSDSRAFREALTALTTNAEATERYAPALSGFAARFSRERFAAAVSKPFRDDAGAAVEQRPPATTRLHTSHA